MCEYVPELGRYYRPADVTVTLNAASWAKLYRNDETLIQLVASQAATIDGDPDEAAALLALFDSFA